VSITPLLAQIAGPKDLANLSISELNRLCAEIRQEIIESVAQNGGHLASNLGVVEISVALHKVFNSPKDKIVWDVGHQCYTHKILTGRLSRFRTLRKAGGVAGFPRYAESPHDVFNTGHASTSISVALGLLQAEHLQGGEGRVIAVTGDGALTGGLAYEALSNAGLSKLPLIIILNDNKMSISANVGGLSKYLSRLSLTHKYQSFKNAFDSTVKKIPFCGEAAYKLIRRLKRAVKAVFYDDNFFVELGFEYVGPIDGHNLAEVIAVLQDAKISRRSCVLHILTKKGKGYPPAEADPGSFHSVPPFDIATGALKQGGRSWTRAFSDCLVGAGKANDKIIAITAAMEKGTGLFRFKDLFPERFFDTGIAEAHSVTFAAALAAAGFRPVVAIYSTFIQRAVDSVLHDVAIGGLPVVFAVDRAGFVPADGETHQGLFDIALFRTVPGMTILAPADDAELKLMFDYALKANSPCMIRYPKDLVPPENPAFKAPLADGRGVLIRGEAEAEAEAATPPRKAAAQAPTGEAPPSEAPPESGFECRRILLAFTGSLYLEAARAQKLLLGAGIPADLYNLRFLKPLDEEYLLNLLKDYAVIAVIEEGVRSGGIGEYISSLLLSNTPEKPEARPELLLFNAGDKYYSVGSREELIRSAGIDAESIFQSVKARWAHS